MNKVIILLGQRVRSGTNFIGSTLAQHPDVVTLPKQTSLGEFNLFKDNRIEAVYSKVTKDSFGMKFDDIDKAIFLENYGIAWLQTLTQKYNISQDKTLFIKSPNVNGLLLWKAAFPESKIAILIRDGRDNVISSVKASNDKRTWHKTIVSLKKRINYGTGRSFINHAKHWKMTARKILNIQEDESIMKFKYEDLNNSKKNITKLLKHYGLAFDESIVEQCLKAPVVGSSFGVNAKGISKPNWKPDFDKSKYAFTHKWKNWGFIKKRVFRNIAGKELIELGYEKDNNW